MGCALHSCECADSPIQIKLNLARRVKRIVKFDPTHTSSLRNRFAADMARRFKKLAKAIIKKVDTDDCFGLKEKEPVRFNAREFQFMTNPKKVHAFMDWLETEVDKGILQITRGPRSAVAGSRKWSDMYIDSAYKKGMEDSWRKLDAKTKAKLGSKTAQEFIQSAFNVPFNADRVGLIYIRTYSKLKGITDAMENMISSSLAEGMAEGRNPYQIARILARRVDGAGFDLSIKDKMGRQVSAIQRARTLARTEVIASHAEASLNTYESAGLQGVEVEAEWSTAGDDRVCPLCAPLEGQIFTIAEARGMLPRHPQCRCSWIPRLKETK